MSEAAHVIAWMPFKQPAHQSETVSFYQTRSSAEKNQCRKHLIKYVQEHLPTLGLPQLDASAADYPAHRLERMIELKQMLKPDYPGKATEQDWAIALANAVR